MMGKVTRGRSVSRPQYLKMSKIEVDKGEIWIDRPCEIVQNIFYI